MTNINSSFRFISWNVRGVGNATKANKIMTHLQQLKGDVFFLQETHLRNKEIMRLKRNWIGNMYHSKFNAKARGTAILIRNNVLFEQHNIVADPDGRFILVSGNLQGSLVTLASVYGPNWDDDSFITKLFSSLPNLENYQLITGGDFNLIQDAVMDRSSSKAIILTKSAKTLDFFKIQLGIVDPWRQRNPNTKAFSFFSNPHRTYTRIDFFLIDTRLLSKVKSCDYHTIAISDHAPVSLDVILETQSCSLKSWRFNSSLLINTEYNHFLRSQISLFLEINDTPEIPRGLLWETSKAYMRGQLISFVSNSRKKELLYTTNLLDKIKDIDFKYSSNQDPSLYTERVKLQSELNLTTTTAAMTQLIKTRQRFFESGDKAGKLLSYQARAEATSKLIPNIKSCAGENVSDLAEINRVFAEYYSDLYSSTSPPTAQEILQTIQFPHVGEELVRGLGRPITLVEVQEAIKSLNPGKSPGPDGFSAEYYKANSDLLAPILEGMYNESFRNCQLPKTLSDATITLILKKDKDPLLCSSYRPISLLNVDFKILSKILALRLQRVLPQIISLDQTGFMTGRHSYHNSRRLLNIIHTPSSSVPEIVVSLDAEKAFDRVEWSFLYDVMDRFGLGEDFVRWVQLLYSSPLASVRTNNNLSPPFSLGRGTRQGCPLSPLLFAIAIEPLAIWLRSEERFKGIMRRGITHKLSLYADDLLLYISDPVTSLPVLLDILDKYGTFSGYKLNYQKSELFPLNSLAKKLPHSIAPFKWVERGFRYLGVIISTSLPDMVKQNFSSLLESVKKDFDRWSLLPLSLVGRVNLIKMAILPKFLYLFQHVPVLLTKSFFDRLDKTISHFLWGGKTVRLRRSILQSAKCEGGLSLPNFRNYYWAANIQKLLYWLAEDNDSLPVWVQMEKLSSRYSLSSILSSSLSLSPALVGDNPIARETIAIWRQLRKHFGLSGPSILTPLLKNCNFIPSVTDLAFRTWHNKGLRQVKDLFHDDVFSSFADLSSKYDLPNSHFFRYLQARDFVKKQFPHFPNRPPETDLDSLLRIDPQQRRCISVLYNILDKAVSKSISSTKRGWEEELQLSLSEQQWNVALKLIHSSSICARHALIQCKVFYKIHYTNAKLSKIYPTVSDNCTRCGQSPANHVHMFWACPKLSAFWRDVFNTLTQAYGQTIVPNALSAIFGIPPNTNISGPLKCALAFTTLLARRLILFKWKLPHPPTHDHWVKDVLFNLKLEKLRFSLKGSVDKFNKNWQSFITLTDSITLVPETED